MFHARHIKKNQKKPNLAPPRPNPKLRIPIFSHLCIPTCKSLFKQTFCYLLLGRVKVGTEMVELNMSIICIKAKVSLSALANKWKLGILFLVE